MRFVQVAVAGFGLAIAIGLFGQPATAATTAGAAGLIFSPAASTKFVNVPFLPRCMKLSIKQGSPRAGSFVTLARIATGCTIPWHWHTANVQLFFVSGLGLHQLGASHGPVEVRPGDFIYLPARSTHSFRCLSTPRVQYIRWS